MMKRYFAVLLVAVLLLGTFLPTGATAATQYATVVGGWLRLRSAASFNASTINSYDTGTQVEVLSVSGKWYNVRTPDGQRGYMYGDYLRMGSTPTPPSPSGDSNAIVVSSNGYGVRLRTGPGTGYRIVRTYAVGTRAYILESGSYWSRIQIGGTTGYMMNQFLKPDGYVPPVYDGDATIWSANGKGVRLRTGPGTGYGKIGVYSVGTQVRILEKGYTWDRVQIGSRVGYMMNEFLIYNDSYKVTGVTINNYNPVVGNMLAVQTLTPATATVTYQWYVGGVAKAGETRASYTVVQDDVGKVIALAVSGAGSYTGSASSTATAKVIGSGVVTNAQINNMSPVVGDTLSVTSITPSTATVSYKWVIGGTKTVTTPTYYVVDADNGQSITLTLTGNGTYTGSMSITTGAVSRSGSITDVTVTNATNPGKDPDAGDTIKAAAVPATANATYKWTVSGVSDTYAGDTLAIKSDWHGKTISVTATGTGAYASSAYSKSVAIGTPKLTVGNLSFADVQVGYAQPAAKYLVVTNSGAAKANVKSITVNPANFIITPATGVVPASSTSDKLWAVQPKTGLAKGIYNSVVTLTYDSGATAAASVAMVVTDAAPKLEIDEIKFTSILSGDSLPDAKTVTIRNMGMVEASNVSIDLLNATAYDLSALSATKIPVNGTATFTIRPKINTTVGNYDTTLNVKIGGALHTSANVKYAVENRPLLGAVISTASIAQGDVTPINITLTATGSKVINISDVRLESSSAGFVLSGGSTEVDVGATDTSWKLTPSASIPLGTYTGKVSFSYFGMLTRAEANFSITVSATPVPPAALTFTDNPTFDVPASVTGTAIAAVNVIGGVSGGTKPYSFSLGSAPAWLNIDASTGAISGTPTTPANATTAIVTVTDSATPAATASITIDVGAVTGAPVPPAALSFTDSPSFDVPASVVNTAITAVNVSGGASGGTKPYSFSLGSAPAWLSIDASTGAITGTPTTAANAATATVTVTDSATPAATASITIDVGAVSGAPVALTFTDSDAYNIPDSTPGAAIGEVNVGGAVSGGKKPYSFSLESAPSWLTIDASTGRITGTPNAAAAATTATVKVTDSAAATASISINVGAVTNLLTFAYSTAYDIPASTAGTAIAEVNVGGAVSGGTPPYSFAIDPAHDWLKIDENTGKITGKPASGYTSAATTAHVKVRDSATPISSAASITINVGAVTDALTFTHSTAYNIPASVVGTPISEVNVSGGVTGGTGTRSFSLENNPTWLSISTDGRITGSPAAAADAATMTIKVTAGSETASITVDVGAVTAPSSISSLSLQPGGGSGEGSGSGSGEGSGSGSGEGSGEQTPPQKKTASNADVIIVPEAKTLRASIPADLTAVSYQWYLGELPLEAMTQNVLDITATGVGIYKVVVTIADTDTVYYAGTIEAVYTVQPAA